MNATKPLALLSLFVGFGVSEASPRGVSRYLPLSLAPEIERAIERVLILADKPVMRRPIAAASVLEALPKACEADPISCRRVEMFLARYMSSIGIDVLGVELAVANNEAAPAVNRHGMTENSAWSVSARAHWQLNNFSAFSVGGIAYEDDAVAAGTILSVGWDFLQLDIGYRDHWWSPMTDSAMSISTQAKTLPSLTVSNYQPLTRLGLQYEVFLAEMPYSAQIRHLDGFTAGRPRLAGVHLAAEPVAGWSVAVNRLVQFGGGARGGHSFGDFWRAFLRPRSYDNRSDDLTQEEELGNQVAALTSRFIVPGEVPFAMFFEYAGEDTSYSGNYRLGNASLSAGLHFPRLWRRFDLTVEASEWQNGWYVHEIYREGLTGDGRVIGHWGADYRRAGDDVGAQSRLVRVAWEPAFGGLLEAHYRTVSNESYSGVDYERAHHLAVRYSRSWSGFLFGAELTAGRDSFGEGFGRLAAFVRLPEDGWQTASRPAHSHAVSRPAGAELFIDTGFSVSDVLARLGDGSPDETIRTDPAPHIAIGARRAVSSRSDLGVRMEFDQVDGHALIGVRALDYRYRIGKRFAVSGFFGAARYDPATPAHGYYLGVGAQWRDLLPGWDLGLDLRFFDKIARDKLLPDDSPPDPRPDVFYDIHGVAVSLSYRW